MSVTPAPREQLAPLAGIPRLRHAFFTRVPGVDVQSLDKAAALERLHPHHRLALREIGMGDWPFVCAEQVHGDGLAVLDEDASGLPREFCLPGVDGLLTRRPGVALGIYVADCAAVFLVDPARSAAGLIHSGRRGTELGIVARAVSRMASAFGSEPAGMLAVLSPCIRPPAYEVDFAAGIRTQCRQAGIPEASIHDPGVCTSADPGRFYSYRREKGRTGRMLAVVGWEP